MKEVTFDIMSSLEVSTVTKDVTKVSGESDSNNPEIVFGAVWICAVVYTSTCLTGAVLVI